MDRKQSVAVSYCDVTGLMELVNDSYIGMRRAIILIRNRLWNLAKAVYLMAISVPYFMVMKLIENSGLNIYLMLSHDDRWRS